MAGKRHYLITGAGMLGAHTARRLLRSGHAVTLLDRQMTEDYLEAMLGGFDYRTVEVDLTDVAATSRALSDLGTVDGVVHTAALIAARAQRDLAETVEVNVAVPLRLAEWAAAAGVPRFVGISSWSVFREQQPAPITEDAPLESQFSSYYIASKLAMEHLLSCVANTTGMEVAVVRPATIYGYGPNLGGGVGSAAIEGQMLRAIHGEPVVLPGNIISQTEIVYADDVAAVVVGALTAALPRPFSWYTAGSQETTTIEQLAETMRELFPEVPVEIGEGASSSVIPPKVDQPTDTAETRRVLGIDPPLSRREGFERFVAELRASGAKGVAR